ncbi:hypothetical protein WME98_31180 [Sorangium sp. So ce296]|uniref:hypothetical protein n=1 Tax=Sorangium sp. So ce296 TaxID=3133296 RepID=UPI003F62D1D4
MSLPARTGAQRQARRRATRGRRSALWLASAAAVAALLAACGPEGAGAEPGPCGGATCTPDQVCVYPPGDCGEGGIVPGNYGVCQPRPASCDTATPREVCACDGRVYENACEAARAGVSIGSGEECGGAAPPGTIACGSYFCDAASEYCQSVEDPHDELFKMPTRRTCEEIPTACMAAPSCDCLAAAAADPREGDCSSAPACTRGESGSFAVRCTGDLY